MATIKAKASREVAAPLEQVWDIVADIDNEPRYWHGTRTVNNISNNGNVIEREVTIAFRNSRCRQTVVLNPKKSVHITITEGPMKGTKTITLSPLAGNNNNNNNSNTRIDVEWDIRLTGMLAMFAGMVKKHITEGTEEALDRIAKAAE